MKIAVIGEVRVPADAIDAARPAMRAMLEATRAEPGCISYAFAQDVLDPGLVRISEVWENRAALTAHFATPHMAEWRKVMGTVGAGGRAIKAYEVMGEETI